LIPEAAWAVDRDETAHAATDGQGVDVIFTRHEDGSAVAHGSSSTCDWHASAYRPESDAGLALPPDFYGPSPGQGFDLYLIWCGNGPVSLRWLGPRDFSAVATQPLVDEALRRVSVLPAGVNVRPDNRGVTGIASLFWVEGYGGAPLQASESAFGLTVQVTAQLVGVEWSFGDGAPSDQSGLGEAWPKRSSVRHTYRNPSGAQPYTVTARLILQPSYTVDGVAGEPLAPIVVQITREYIVHEVQAERRS
jgi:hypothetical protein